MFNNCFYTLRWITAIFSMALALLFVSVNLVSAGNVPGSATAAVPELSEISTGQLVSGIRKIRGNDRGNGSPFTLAPVVSMGSSGWPVVGLEGHIRNGDMSLVSEISFRNVVIDSEFDVNLITASSILAYQSNPALQIFGGLIGENIGGETFYNDGTLNGTGVGGAFGLDYKLNNRTYVTLITGLMWLDYDFTRSAGAIDGSFDASRIFVDLSGDTTLQNTTSETNLSFGIRYIQQQNEGFTESGGAIIEASSSESFALTFASHTDIIATNLGLTPYIETSVRYDTNSTLSLPVGVLVPDDTRLHTRVGFGVANDNGKTSFELGLGANITEHGYNGMDAKLSFVVRF